MLLNFTVKNYKSFRDENIFSMVPAPKQKGLDYIKYHRRYGYIPRHCSAWKYSQQ